MKNKFLSLLAFLIFPFLLLSLKNGMNFELKIILFTIFVALPSWALFCYSNQKKSKASILSLSFLLAMLSTYLMFFPFEINLFFGGPVTIFNIILSPLLLFIPSYFSRIDYFWTIPVVVGISLLIFSVFYILSWLILSFFQKLQSKLSLTQKQIQIGIVVLFILLCLLLDPDQLFRGIEL